jgi:hypothetical protein
MVYGTTSLHGELYADEEAVGVQLPVPEYVHTEGFFTRPAENNDHVKVQEGKKN